MTKHGRLFVFLSVLSLVVALGAFAQQKGDETAIDPVCGMTVVKAKAAATHDHNSVTYYFCSTGCKDAFAKDPGKYLEKTAAAQAAKKPMMHMGQMAAGMEPGMDCPFWAPDVEFKVEKTADGVILRITSKNPESVKAIQEHAGKMQEMKKNMGKGMGKDGCPGCPDGCPAKKARRN